MNIICKCADCKKFAADQEQATRRYFEAQRPAYYRSLRDSKALRESAENRNRRRYGYSTI